MLLSVPIFKVGALNFCCFGFTLSFVFWLNSFSLCWQHRFSRNWCFVLIVNYCDPIFRFVSFTVDCQWPKKWYKMLKIYNVWLCPWPVHVSSMHSLCSFLVVFVMSLGFYNHERDFVKSVWYITYAVVPVYTTLMHCVCFSDLKCLVKSITQ
jgi:hypothetical protein